MEESKNVSTRNIERVLCKQGISETRENRKMAASKDWKNILAPAKKKFPMLQQEYKIKSKKYTHEV